MDKESPLKRIAQGTFILFIGVFLSKILGYGYRVLIARNGVEEYGIFSIALAVYGLILAFASLGIPEGIARYVGFFRGEDELGKMRKSLKMSLRVLFFTGVLAVIVSYFLARPIAEGVFHIPELTIVLQIIILAIPFDMGIRIFVNSLRGLEKPRYEVYIRNIVENIVKIGLTGMFFILGVKLVGMTVSFVIAIFISFILLGYYLNKNFSLFKKTEKYPGLQKELLLYSLPLFLSNVLIFVFTWVDTLMLGWLVNAHDVGLYNAAVPTSQLLYLFPSTLMAMFLPILTMVWAQKNPEQFRNTFQSATRWILIINLALVIPLFIFSKEILGILFGGVYGTASVALMILLVGRFIDFSLLAGSNVLMVVKRTKLLLFNNLITAVLNVVLNLIFIPKYGIAGAALGTSIAVSLQALLVLIETKILTKHLALTKNSLKILLNGFVAGAVLYLVSDLVEINIVMIALLSLFFLVMYLFLLYTTRSFKQEDLDVVLQIESKMGINLKLVKKILRKFKT